jgi:RsiW-degrading membrane proteinase PrsW (M82 family)
MAKWIGRSLVGTAFLVWIAYGYNWVALDGRMPHHPDLARPYAYMGKHEWFYLNRHDSLFLVVLMAVAGVLMWFGTVTLLVLAAPRLRMPDYPPVTFGRNGRQK